MNFTVGGFWLPLFCCLLLSHIAAQAVAILLRPWVLRQPTRQTAEAVRRARVEAQEEIEQTLWGEGQHRAPRRRAGYMSGVRSVPRRREEYDGS